MEKYRVVLMDLTQYGADPDVARSIESMCRLMRFGANITDHDISAFAPLALCAEFDYPDITRLATLSALKRRHPELPILMFTEQHSEALAVWALRARMWNYFVKPIDHELVHESIEILHCARKEKSKSPAWPMLMPSVSLPKEIRFRDEAEERRSLLNVAQNFIDTHLSVRISVEKVAAACGLGPVQFAREFKHAFGSTFSNYLLKRRIHLACELLRNRSASVNDIGWTVGLRDPSHFTRTFRAHVGLSPSEYRSLWQEQHRTASTLRLVRETESQAYAKLSNEHSKLS